MFFKKKIHLLFLFLYTSGLTLLLFLLINDDTRETVQKKENAKPEARLNQFGFVDDSLTIRQANIKPNETLSAILMQFNLAGDKIAELINFSEDYIDHKKIIAGNNYYSFMSDDSLNELQYFVYEKDPVNYIVFDIADSIRIYSGQKQVKRVRKTMAAEIEQSLYTAMLKNEASPELVIKLSEVFAWQIDFYRIQQGDYFKVIYEEEFVDNKSIGIKNILSAYFDYSGEEFFAFPFIIR